MWIVFCNHFEIWDFDENKIKNSQFWIKKILIVYFIFVYLIIYLFELNRKENSILELTEKLIQNAKINFEIPRLT